MSILKKIFQLFDPKNKKWILIVEDNKILSDMYKYKLELEWYKVLTAENGKIWLQIINDIDFDLILLDIMMPEMNWLELLEQLKYSARKAIVFVFSNINNPQKRDEALALWADEYIVKSSLTPRELIQKIKWAIW